MNQTVYTDEKLIQMIGQSNRERNAALHFIYQKWRNYAKAIMRKGGADPADADDAIQEAIVVLDNSIRNGKFEHASSLKNYFIGICKGRLYSNKRSTRRIDYTDDHLKMDDVETREPETIMLEDEQRSVIDNMLNMLDEKCQNVLYYYKLGYANKEIAEQTGLSNDNTARQWVFKCRKRLVELARKNPLFTNYFKNRV